MEDYVGRGEQKRRRIEPDEKDGQNSLQRSICIQCVMGFAKRLESFLVETYPVVEICHVDVPLSLVFFTCKEEFGQEDTEKSTEDKSRSKLVSLVESFYAHQYLLRYIGRFFFFDEVAEVQELLRAYKLKEDKVPQQKDNVDEDKSLIDECLSSMLDRISFPSGCVVRAQMWPKAIAEMALCDHLESRGITASPTDFTHLLCLLIYQDKWYWGLYEKEPFYYEKDNDALKVESAISRAYYKIQEACLRFKIPLDETTKVLDLGAAPGGWSQWLSQVAHIVVAVDPANMRIPTHKTATFAPRTQPSKETEVAEVNSNAPSTTNVYHIQLRFEDSQLHEELTRLGPEFDLIVCDVNFPADNAIDKLLPMVRKYLRVGGHFIMTLKLQKRKVHKRDKMTRGQIDEGTAYFIEKMTPMCQTPDVKFLFSNKNERTLHSIKLQAA